jgi:hypothetical protein
MILDLAGFDARDRAGQTGFGRDCEDSSFSSLRNVDRIVNIGATIGIVPIGDHDNYSPSLGRAHLFITELPDSVIQRCLLPGVLH